MALICVNCTLRAIVEGREPPKFDHSPEEHLRLYHPDPYAATRERRDLERELLRRLDDQSN